MTEVLRVDPATPDPVALARAAAIMRGGGLVAFPTETVYGLGAVVDHDAALAAVFAAKGRPVTDPLIVHAADRDGFADVVAGWDDRAEGLARRFWPGPLTLVVPRGPAAGDRVTAGGAGVGVRVPAHPTALALLRTVGRPVAAPSANRFGRVSPTAAQHVLEELDGRIDAVVDAGPTPLGVESTVLDLTGAVPRVLRPGGVTLEDLREALGPVEHAERRSVAPGVAAASPGQLLAHYAPSTPLVLAEGGVAARDAAVAAMSERTPGVEALELPEDAGAAAQRLYGALREADRRGARLLVAATLDPEGLGRAVNDRLFRAAHGRLLTDPGATSVDHLLAALGLGGAGTGRS